MDLSTGSDELFDDDGNEPVRKCHKRSEIDY